MINENLTSTLHVFEEGNSFYVSITPSLKGAELLRLDANGITLGTEQSEIKNLIGETSTLFYIDNENFIGSRKDRVVNALRFTKVIQESLETIRDGSVQVSHTQFLN